MQMRSDHTVRRLLAACLATSLGVTAWGQVLPDEDLTTPAGQNPTPGSQPLDAEVSDVVIPIEPEIQGRPTVDEPSPTDVPSGDDVVRFDAFTEAVELTTLITFLAEELSINITTPPGMSGSIAFNAPVSVPRDELLTLVDSLLALHDFTISLDRTGFYNVVSISGTDIPVNPSGEVPTTQVIATPNIRPSTLQDVLTKQFGQLPARLAFLDEIGIIMITDSPRRIEMVREVVDLALEERAKASYHRFELEYLSAAVAVDRLARLVGQGGTSGLPIPGRDPTQTAASGVGGSGLSNLSQRLEVDAQGNALLFRGRDEERSEIEMLLEIVDVPNNLEPRRYYTGTATRSIAEFAEKRGLGAISTIDSQTSSQGLSALQQQQQQQLRNALGGQTQQSEGGPLLLTDEQRGEIVYYGTSQQHLEMARLIEQFDTEAERIVIMNYKLHNADAQEVADIVLGLLENRTPTSQTAPLLPSGQRQPPRAEPTAPRGGQGDELSILGGEETFVIADPANNQVLVKAPANQQDAFSKLISKLDLRRPQVYIEAQIVAVIATDDFRLGFETQLINANGAGGVVNTNFGIGTPNDASVTIAKTVTGALTGMTAAIINSDQVPLVINAIATETETHILSRPQLLVDDNEEATVTSVEQQPTASRSFGQTTDAVSFDSFQDAGTVLTVTPRISEGGYLSLNYSIELSSFIGAGTDTLPPARQRNTIEAGAVTLPSDSTVVIGGIVVDTDADSVVKVPLLGDIPLFGALFRDQSDNGRKTLLYVFLTPKILSEPTLRDYLLLTEGPQQEVGMAPDIPEMMPSMIEIIESLPVGDGG